MAPEVTLERQLSEGQPEDPFYNALLLRRNLKRKVPFFGVTDNCAPKKRRTFPCWDRLSSPKITATKLAVNLKGLVPSSSNASDHTQLDNASTVQRGRAVPCNVNLSVRIDSGEGLEDTQLGLSDVRRGFIQYIQGDGKTFCKIFLEECLQIDLRHLFAIRRESQQWVRLRPSKIWLKIQLSFLNSEDFQVIIKSIQGIRKRRHISGGTSDQEEGVLITYVPLWMNQQPQKALEVEVENFRPAKVVNSRFDFFRFEDKGHSTSTDWKFDADIDWVVPERPKLSQPRFGSLEPISIDIERSVGYTTEEHIADYNSPVVQHRTRAAKGLADAHQTDDDVVLEFGDEPQNHSVAEKMRSRESVRASATSAAESTPVAPDAAQQTPNAQPTRPPLQTPKSKSRLTPQTTSTPDKTARAKRTDPVPQKPSLSTTAPNLSAPSSSHPSSKRSKKDGANTVRSTPQVTCRKRHKVPQPPKGVTFFRTFSRRPLEPGEYLSESDNEIDESWLKRLHARTIDKLHEASLQEKKFMKLFDLDLLDAKPTGDRSFAEFLKEFAKRHASLLRRDEELTQQFCIKMTTLILDGIITHQFFEECLEALKAVESSPASRTRKKARSNNERRSNDKGENSMLPFMMACKCGKQVKSVHDAVICRSTHCEYREFHLRCAGLEVRPPGEWHCDRCRVNEFSSVT